MRSVPLPRYRCGISFPSRPTPSPRLSSVCLLDLIPRPRAWDELAAVDLRLRAWRRSSCLLSYRAALSLPLVRYCGSTRPAGRVATLSCRCRSVIFLVGLFLTCGRMVRCRGSASRLPCRLTVRFISVPPSRHPARRTVRGVVCAVSSIKRRVCR